VELGAMGGPPNAGGFEAMTGLRASVPFTAKWSAEAGGGLLAGTNAVSVMDPSLGASFLVAQSASALVRVGAAATLPLGTVTGGGLGLAPRSSQSVDPRLSLSAVVGATWLGVASANVRAPLYEGGDGVRQGTFARGELDLARRIGGDWVTWGGLSVLGAGESSAGSGDFIEVAPVAGALWNVGEQISLGARLRVPVYGGDDGVAYPVAGGLTLRWVAAKAEEEDHHDGDGH
jgi:hypothetical protein